MTSLKSKHVAYVITLSNKECCADVHYLVLHILGGSIHTIKDNAEALVPATR